MPFLARSRKGVNAIEYAAEVIAHLKSMAGASRGRGPFDHHYDVPCTTVHTGIVHGGTALNIVPKDCRFDFEFRYLPGVDPEALYGDVRAFAEPAGAGDECVTAMPASPGDDLRFPGLDTRRRPRSSCSPRRWRRPTPRSRSRSAPKPA
jgi:acetylornithine deacetylase